MRQKTIERRIRSLQNEVKELRGDLALVEAQVGKLAQLLMVLDRSVPTP